MKKRLLIGGIITVIIVGVGLASYFTITNNIKKENALKIVQLNKQKADEKKANDKKLADEKALAEAKEIEDAKAQAILDAQAKADAELAKIVDVENVYIRMHGMINTKIVSKDGLYYGEIPITTEDCDKLIKIINDNNYSDKKTLLAFLNSWKKKDFSNGVKQHNYIWIKLGRGEGEAIALR
jgi:cell division protein FtsB